MIRWFKRLFHTHSYEIIHKETIESKYQSGRVYAITLTVVQRCSCCGKIISKQINL